MPLKRLSEKLKFLLVSVASVALIGSVLTPQPATAAVQSYWHLQKQECQERSTYGMAKNVYMDVCWEAYQLIHDGSNYYNYWTLKAFATIHVDDGRWWQSLDDLEWATLKVGPFGSNTMAWVDWAPRHDYSGDCRTETLSVTFGGVGLSTDVQQCENWTFSKSTQPGVFRVTWNAGSGLNKGNRSLASQTTIRVLQGKEPKWNVTKYARLCYDWC